MNTFEAIKLLMEQDIRADFGEIHNHESVAEHLAERIDTLWNENEKLKARNEQLEAALRYYAKEYENPFGGDDSLIARVALGMEDD